MVELHYETIRVIWLIGIGVGTLLQYFLTILFYMIMEIINNKKRNKFLNSLNEDEFYNYYHLKLMENNIK